MRLLSVQLQEDEINGLFLAMIEGGKERKKEHELPAPFFGMRVQWFAM
jgi:hypothetical protein